MKIIKIKFDSALIKVSDLTCQLDCKSGAQINNQLLEIYKILESAKLHN